MATLNLNLNSPSGWNKWLYPKTTEFGVQLPDASFPYIYTPANAFWVRSIINHCLVPWINVLDPLSSFALAGGFTGTVAASMSALAVFNELKPISEATGSFSLVGNAPGPIFGYCIGNSFKQNSYLRFDVQNSIGPVILMDSVVEYLENSRFKRIYVNHGEIVNYRFVNGKYILTLDINRVDSPTEDAKFKIKRSGAKIKITQSTGKIFDLNILELLDNWDVVISAPPNDNVPKSGDFYQLAKTWCIEDPYLISGFWQGRENDVGGSDPSSGLNLFKTQHNKPYEKGKILGVYIWKKEISTTTTTTTTSGEQTTTTTTATTLLSQPSYGTNMNDVGDYGWAFLGFGNSRFSDIYKNDIRYKEVALDRPDGDGATVVIEKRDPATQLDYQRLINNPLTSYVRVDISRCAYVTRHNWYSPCLKGCYLNSNGKLYKILSHVEANVIDVSLKSIDGQNTLDIVTNQDYTILNQYAWMITENYFQSAGSARDTTGVFDGVVKSTVTVRNVGKYVKVTCKPIQRIMTILKGGISLLSRYTKTYTMTDMEALYSSKYSNYKLVMGTTTYNVDSIMFDNNFDQNPQLGVSFDIDVWLKDGELAPDVGRNVYISMDTPYSVNTPYTPKTGFSFSLEVQAGLNESGKLGFIKSDTLCLDGEFFSAPYTIDIPIDSRIGITEGYLFGMEINGSASSRIGAVTLVTTPRAFRGIASMFHSLRQEDWAVYQDQYTQKITIRRGSLDFRDYPMKEMVVIGKPKTTDPIESGESLQLDTTYEWLRRIQFDVRNINDVKAIIFAIGNKNNIYGNYVSGDGLVDLQAFRRQGIGAGNVASSTYTGNDFIVSPVYSYNRDYYQNQTQEIIDIGVKTTDGDIIPKPLTSISAQSSSSAIQELSPVTLNNVYGQYIEDNQTLEEVGLFDIVRLAHGESILIYSQKIPDFSIDATNTTTNVVTTKINNSTNAGNRWNNQNGVMIIGTYDDDFTWAKPIVNRIDDNDDVNQFALMVMNSVDYLGCIYNPRTESLSIFALCYHDEASYIGCFTIDVLSLSNDNFLCKPIPEDFRKFSWRHPQFQNAYMANEDKFWTDVENVVLDGLSVPSNGDTFVRVMGSGSTSPQIVYNKEPGIISVSMLPDGSYILFYDALAGIKAVYSNDGGQQWRFCDLIYARDARGGVLIGQMLFYITSSGIEVKRTSYADFGKGVSLSAKKDAGNDISELEILVQESLDSLDKTLIGSGPIGFQRISGYVTHTGVTKVFFYDANNLLKCIESNDGLKWNVSNNF